MPGQVRLRPRSKRCLGELKLPTVLVVEDDKWVRSTVVDTLSESGLKVVAAANASRAVTLLGHLAPIHLVLTDLTLSGPTNGVELVRFAKRQHPHVKVVFLSADAANAAIRKLGDGFLFKPCDPGALVQTVANVLAAA